MKKEVLNEIVEKHNQWMNDEGGKRANLRYADLLSAGLLHANLRYADLNWSSHSLLAEILRQYAGESREKREIAGLIEISKYWCWDSFKKEADSIRDYLLDWAARSLLETAGNPDEAPDLIKYCVDNIDNYMEES